MSSRSPIGQLMHEHRQIERMVHVLEVQLTAIESGTGADPDLLLKAVKFARGFADECHHGKEERILFRDLANKNMDLSLADMMQRLIDDHVRARKLVARIEESSMRYRSGSPGASAELSEALREVTALYPEHIETEDHRFFKPAISLFSPEERAAMGAEFDEFEAGMPHEGLLALIDEMEREAAVPHTTLR